MRERENEEKIISQAPIGLKRGEKRKKKKKKEGVARTFRGQEKMAVSVYKINFDPFCTEPLTLRFVSFTAYIK